MTQTSRHSAPLWLTTVSLGPQLGRAIKAAALLAAIGALVAAGVLVYQAIDKEDTFFIENADLSDPDFLTQLRYASAKDPTIFRSRPPVGAHRLRPGRGAVFGYRWYSNGRTDTIGDERYIKLTVWFPDGIPPRGKDIDLRDRSKAIIVFASGSSAWPQYACSGYVSSGSVRLVDDEGGYRVEVHGALKPTAKLPGLNPCHARRIDREFLANKISYERLTPWLGLAGTQAFDETYR